MPSGTGSGRLVTALPLSGKPVKGLLLEKIFRTEPIAILPEIGSRTVTWLSPERVKAVTTPSLSTLKFVGSATDQSNCKREGSMGLPRVSRATIINWAVWSWPGVTWLRCTNCRVAKARGLPVYLFVAATNSTSALVLDLVSTTLIKTGSNGVSPFKMPLASTVIVPGLALENSSFSKSGSIRSPLPSRAMTSSGKFSPTNIWPLVWGRRKRALRLSGLPLKLRATISLAAWVIKRRALLPSGLRPTP